MTHYSHYSEEINTVFLQVFHDFFQNGITPIFFSDYPQRAETFLRGYSAVVAQYPQIPQKMKLFGGRVGENPFPRLAEQFGYAANFDNFTAENMLGIAELLPAGSYAIASYEQCPDLELRSVLPPSVQALHQYHSQLGILVLENKQWLKTILEQAGLSDVVIPHQSYSLDNSTPSFQEVTQLLQSTKVVLQGGLTTHGGTSGSDTVITDDDDEFSRALLQRRGRIKCSRFISGLQGNYSLVVGNVRPSATGYGCYQLDLPGTVDPREPSSAALTELLSRSGLQAEEVIALPVRGSAKIVGEPHCTYAPLEGAVHDLGFVYSKQVRDQLYLIASKLGKLAARMGYVGILGFDFIVDSNNKVWVNEINARQQGPTSMLGVALEQNVGLFDCLKLAYVFAFSTQFQNGHLTTILKKMQQSAAEMAELAATSPGPYYLKIQALFSPDLTKKVTKTFRLPAIYTLSSDPESEQALTVQSTDIQGLSHELPKTKFGDSLEVMLIGSTLHAEQEIIGGTQLCRVAGQALSVADGPIEVVTHSDGSCSFSLKKEYQAAALLLQAEIF